MISPKQTIGLWTDSPCSFSYTSQLPPLEKAKRFHINSIYYRDNPSKPVKQDDQLKKPELLLYEFRRNLKEVDSSIRRKVEVKKKSLGKTTRNAHTIDHSSTFSKDGELIQRLCPSRPLKLKQQYDLYGNRSSFVAPGSEQLIFKKKNSQKSVNIKKNESFFSESKRKDISRPENFNPGPGSYFIEQNSSSKYLSESQSQRSSQQKVFKSEKFNTKVV